MKLLKPLLIPVALTGLILAMPGHSETANAKDPARKPAVEQVSQAPVNSLVNINQADAATLADKLNGVGLKKAQAIVSYREQNGPFKSVEDVVNVAGIGESTLEKNRSLISIN